MDITKINHQSGVQNLLSSIYNVSNQPQHTAQSRDTEQNIQGVDSIHNQDKTNRSLQSVDVIKRIEDKFSPSAELRKAKEIGGELRGGFGDKASFEKLSNTLKKEGLIDNNEQVAMEYLKNNVSKLSFDEFEKVASNDQHTREMKGWIDSVVHKMKYIDSVNGGIF